MNIITNKNALLSLCLITGHFLFAQIDKSATKETKNLYKNLKTISKNHILLGISMLWNMDTAGIMNQIGRM